LKTLECDNYNVTYLRNLSVSLKDSQLNVNFNLISSLVAGLRVNMDFYSRKENINIYHIFYSYSFDACTLMSTMRSNLFKRWFASFFAYGNFKPDCPVPPSHYYIKNYNIKNLDIPTFLFPGYYRFVFNIIQNRKKEKRSDSIISCSVEIKMK
ncbi:hypothetical protein KR093_004720, partial [Drosophila rubida]